MAGNEGCGNATSGMNWSKRKSEPGNNLARQTDTRSTGDWAYLELRVDRDPSMPARAKRN